MARAPGATVVEAERNLAISNGRKFQMITNAYMLPTDSGEHSRLDLQHEAVRLMLGGELYQTPELVKASLSPQENAKRRILDVGTGSGKWAIKMAEEFPHADILGIDLAEPDILSDSTRRVPPNCSFKVVDANKDMGEIDSGYDLVHVRCVEPGIDDSDLFFYDVARVLRPGGLLLLVAGDAQLFDENGKYVPLQEPSTVGMLESNPNYSNVQMQELLVPSGPWSNDLKETEQKLADTMQANLLRLVPAFKASLLRDKSLQEEFVNNLAEGAMKEVQELPSVIHRYSKWVFATAIRNTVPWATREMPWQEPPGYDLYDYVVRPLPKK
ncbi:hypothetical protein FS837_001746 [Tulasnella sp. UAMH 9824]|nr:hypothetical protein FS837_001746 [Tulasnella sp. UAMH 9824]